MAGCLRPPDAAFGCSIQKLLGGNNSNGVSTLGFSANSNYDQNEMQAIIGKIDELINALRR